MGWIEFELTDHTGVFKPAGKIKICLDNEAAQDFNKAMSGHKDLDSDGAAEKIKNGPEFDRAKYYFSGKQVALYIRDVT